MPNTSFMQAPNSAEMNLPICNNFFVKDLRANYIPEGQLPMCREKPSRKNFREGQRMISSLALRTK